MSYGMLAPRPTKNACVLVLLACLTVASLLSTPMTVVTVYLPLTAVHEPSVTGADVAPEAMAPGTEPVRVLRTALVVVSVMVNVMLCAAVPEAMVPWFLMAAVNVTVLPADGFPGDHPTPDATRSELEI